MGHDFSAVGIFFLFFGGGGGGAMENFPKSRTRYAGYFMGRGAEKIHLERHEWRGRGGGGEGF